MIFTVVADAVTANSVVAARLFVFVVVAVAVVVL